MTYDVDDFSTLLPGDIIFTGMGEPAKTVVKFGQTLLNDDCRFEHVALALGDGIAVEARPPKARVFDIDPTHSSLYFRLPLTDEQRDLIWINASVVEVKYSWLAFPHLGLIRLGLTSDWMTRTLMGSRRRICSQLVDERLTKSGFQVFNDGRTYGDVTPGDLYYRFSLDPMCVSFRLDGKKNWEM